MTAAALRGPGRAVTHTDRTEVVPTQEEAR